MAVTNVKKILKKAQDEGYAIPHFNVNNLETIKAVLDACQEKKSPVIIAITESAATYFGGLSIPVEMIRAYVKEKNLSIPVVIHLDHGSYEGCKKALNCGFTSIMFDGSSLDIEENIAKTKELRKLSTAKDISLEAEVGTIGGKEDGAEIDKGELANPIHCKKMLDVGVDSLAAGIGNIHGMYPDNWKGLNFKTLQAIKEATNGKIPLVLHGGSGIAKKQVKKAISLGVNKVNVGTQIHIANANALANYFAKGKHKGKKGFDIRKLNVPAIAEIKKLAISKIELCGSTNKA